MLELSVNSKSPAAINSAFKKIKDMIMTGAVARTTAIHVVLEPGYYRELIKYNLSNPLVIESAPGTKPEDCVIQADNCEAFNKGLENRAVFVLGPNVTNVSLKNFTIANTHSKTVMEGSTLADSAEALVWNNTTGTLFAQGMHIEGRQNTLCLKGFSWFKDCLITGDTDFIYGDLDTALFEECEVNVREDNRGDFPGYAVKSLAFANKPGFVFMNCRFTAEKRKKSSVYVYRTEGHGGADKLKWWDSAAFINCFMSEVFDPEMAWDDDMELELYPRGNVKTGIREYNTRVVGKGGKVEEADTTKRNIRSYLLTDDDYFSNYASRYLILHDTPFAEISGEQ